MKILDAILVGGVRFYRWVLSPAKAAFFGPAGRCRFEPSCSEYALEAIQTHGAAIGGWLSLTRILRCHPWGGCGHDPVPPRLHWPTPRLRGPVFPKARSVFGSCVASLSSSSSSSSSTTPFFRGRGPGRERFPESVLQTPSLRRGILPSPTEKNLPEIKH